MIQSLHNMHKDQKINKKDNWLMAIMILIFSLYTGSCIFRSCTGWIMYFQILYWLDHAFSDHVLAGSCIFRSCTGWIIYFQIMYWLDHAFSDLVLAGSCIFRSCTAGSCTGWIISFQIMYWLDRLFSDHVLHQHDPGLHEENHLAQ